MNIFTRTRHVHQLATCLAGWRCSVASSLLQLGSSGRALAYGFRARLVPTIGEMESLVISVGLNTWDATLGMGPHILGASTALAALAI